MGKNEPKDVDGDVVYGDSVQATDGQTVNIVGGKRYVDGVEVND